MLSSTDRPALIVLLGEQDSSQSFYSITRLADAIMARFGTSSTDDFLSSITAYDPREKKITAIRDLREARRLGTVEGSEGLKECKEDVESWIARNPSSRSQAHIDALRERLTGDPWANVSRQAQYGYGDSWHDDEPPF